LGRVDIAARRWSIASRRSRRSSVERQRDAEEGEKKNKMNYVEARRGEDELDQVSRPREADFVVFALNRQRFDGSRTGAETR
jgi:hypothetical protein